MMYTSADRLCFIYHPRVNQSSFCVVEIKTATEQSTADNALARVRDYPEGKRIIPCVLIIFD